MRILFLNAYVPPSDAPASRLIADLAGALAAAGHEVSFLGNRSGYRDRRQTGLASRALGELARMLGILAGGVFRKRPDLIVATTSPPLLPAIAGLVAGRHGTRFILWAMDLYPEIPIAIGLMKAGHPLVRLTGKLNRIARRRCERIIALDAAMVRRLEPSTEGIPLHSQLPWPLPEHLGSSSPEFPSEPPGKTWLYSGNLGRVHEWKCLLEAQHRLEERFGAEAPTLVFQGGGAQFEPARREAARLELTRCRFRPHRSDADLLPELLGASVVVATQRPETAGMLWPSKLALLLRVDRPLLWIGPENDAVAARVREGKAAAFLPDQTDAIADWVAARAEGPIGDSMGFDHEIASARRKEALEEWLAWIGIEPIPGCHNGAPRPR
ncbi:MAG: hypothetical protein KDM91_15055 [Verrucomicrobiae bacterium]|nr:hypothetical protein [Verrucomicrobiae bacterium]MCP5541969.1 hypothetical protein [Akkermansiaceae bacterium]